MLQKPKKIPENPGVYIFRDRVKRPLYIGKAASIKRRLASYFQSTISDRIMRLREEAYSLSFETTETEFDALIREAELIKKHRPKFNILMRDDKNYYYIVFTNEVFPRIFVTHQPESRSAKNIIGPFTEGRALFMILRLLRKLFPYCTCKRPHKRPCVNSEMGRCFGFCCTLRSKKNDVAERTVYKKSIQSIRNILSGKSRTLLRELKKEMTGAAKEKRYEKAGEIRNQYLGLQSIISHRHIIQDRNPFIFRRAKESSELRHILKRENPVARIEGYDISNISGKEATASRVVFIDGKPEKSEYKRFKIRFKGISDFDMLKEVMTPGPVCIRDDALAAEAVRIFNERNIDDLIVVNAKREP
ncbi:MAG: GIY-YIG nuclease family protein, partial [Patescibacteria group bacterium]